MTAVATDFVLVQRLKVRVMVFVEVTVTCAGVIVTTLVPAGVVTVMLFCAIEVVTTVEVATRESVSTCFSRSDAILTSHCC